MCTESTQNSSLFFDRPRRGAPGLDQQLTYYENFFTWGVKGRARSTMIDATRWLAENKPDPEPLGLVWGDARLGNILFDEVGEAKAVLDWEMVAVANPLQDLAYWLILDRHHSEGYGVPRLAGFPSYEETVSAWEEGTRLSASHLDYYESSPPTSLPSQ